MARPQGHTLTKRIVDRLSVDGKDAIFWDRDLPGFGVRVYPHGRKLYVVQTRAFGRSKRVTIGEHDNPVSADQARKKATEDHRAHQARQARSRARAGRRADRRRPRRALRARACRGPLQVHDRAPLRPHAAQAHRAGPRAPAGRRGPEERHRGLLHRPAREPDSGQPRGRHPGAHVPARRRLGLAPVGAEPLPGHEALQGPPAPRAVPHPRGARPARRSRSRRRRPSGWPRPMPPPPSCCCC